MTQQFYIIFAQAQPKAHRELTWNLLSTICVLDIISKNQIVKEYPLSKTYISLVVLVLVALAFFSLAAFNQTKPAEPLLGPGCLSAPSAVSAPPATTGADQDAVAECPGNCATCPYRGKPDAPCASANSCKGDYEATCDHDCSDCSKAAAESDAKTDCPAAGCAR